jgi:hypothetical protein
MKQEKTRCRPVRVSQPDLTEKYREEDSEKRSSHRTGIHMRGRLAKSCSFGYLVSHQEG